MNEAKRLIQNLQRAEAFDHPVETLELLETHISWVLLTGPMAYKIKKPVNLGFADFSTLQRRRFFCLEELRLNRRLAPELYLAVRPVCGPRDAPRLGPPLPEAADAAAVGRGGNMPAGDTSTEPTPCEAGAGEILDYAVQMKQFAHEQLAPAALARGDLLPRHWDRLAVDVARFHASVAQAEQGSRWGSPEVAGNAMRENFRNLVSAPADEAFAAVVRSLRDWTESRLAEVAPLMVRRQAGGFVRECHGDMHLGNMVFLNDALVLFDCIDFNDTLRWIDVLSEIAFTVMDLEDRAQTAAAFRFLNGYLEQTGDYAGLALLPLFLVYRAMVRAKVAFIRGQQGGVAPEEQQRLESECREYVQLARRYASPLSPHLVLMHGLSGSGKTTWSTRILETARAIRIRSDVERKRLFGLWPEGSAGDDPAAAVPPSVLYGSDAGQRTYAQLLHLAESILAAGFTAIVDATFLRQQQRQPFLDLAARLGVPVTIAQCSAPMEELHRRAEARAAAGRDASDAGAAVVDLQRRNLEPLTAKERAVTVALDERGNGWDTLCHRLESQP